MNYKDLMPGRAKSKKKIEDLWDDAEWIAEEKYNGWRFLTHLGRGLERVYMTGRRISDVTGRLSEKGLCATPLWPARPLELDYTVLDGEVLPPLGATFHDIAGIMNVDPVDAHERIRQIGPPRYVVFDILFLNGVEMHNEPQMYRKREAGKIVDRLANPLVSLAPTIEHDKLAHYDRIVEGGGEGVILKNFASIYGEDWIKVKKFSTLDVIVTGFKDGEGKYSDQIGSVLVSVHGAGGMLVEVGKVSGMTDEVRRDMTDNPGRWLGTVIEVRAQEFGRDRLLHPRFFRERPDANAKDATWTKMMRDLKANNRKLEDEEGQQLLDI